VFVTGHATVSISSKFGTSDRLTVRWLIEYSINLDGAFARARKGAGPSKTIFNG